MTRALLSHWLVLAAVAAMLLGGVGGSHRCCCTGSVEPLALAANTKGTDRPAAERGEGGCCSRERDRGDTPADERDLPADPDRCPCPKTCCTGGKPLAVYRPAIPDLGQPAPTEETSTWLRALSGRAGVFGLLRPPRA